MTRSPIELFWPAKNYAQVCLETKKPMRPGKLFTLELKFEYKLTDSLVGFYLSTYKVFTSQMMV